MTQQDPHRIETREQLESALGKPSLGAVLKSIDSIDAPAAALLALSPMAVLAAAGADGRLAAWIAGGRPAVARVLDRHRLVVPRHASAPRAETRVAALFFVPGLGETLRVNGTLHARDGANEIHVEELFVHCAKALIRSRFWTTGTAGCAPVTDPDAFLAAAPFVALASIDADGRVDVSPRGDPAGFVGRGDDSALVIPDRPGNRRTDTFHNVVADPRVAVVAFVPGSEQALSIAGRAHLTTDPALCARLAVQGRRALAALVVAPERVALAHDAGIAAAVPWDPRGHVAPGAIPRAADVLAAHVRANRKRGVLPSLIRTIVSANAIERGLARDYEKRLY